MGDKKKNSKKSFQQNNLQKKVGKSYKDAKKATDKYINKSRKFILANQFTQLAFLAALITLGLLVIYFLSSFLSDDKVGLDYVIAQLMHTMVAVGIAWILTRTFKLVLVQYYKTKTNAHIPRYLITFFNWAVILTTLLFISTIIFEQDGWKIITAGGIIGAGLAFSLQGIVLDAVSGLILDVERTYKKGDWIHLNDETRGRVTNTTWRYVEVLTEHLTLITIPNRMLTSDKYENLTHGTQPYAEHITLSIDHNVPIERAERVMLDALMSIEEVVKTGIHGVYARGANEGGVMFQVRFGIEDYGLIRPIRHKVMHTILRRLHDNNLKLSETIGEYALSKAKPFEYEQDYPVENIIRDVSLFSMLTDKEQTELAQKATRIQIDRGDDLIVIGDDTDSLMIIAEGIVDVIVPVKSGQATKNEVVATLRAGNFVGDRALLLGEKRSATVRASSPVLAYEITKNDIAPLLKKRPEILDYLSKIMAERELETSTKVKAATIGPKKQQSLAESLKASMKTFFNI